MTVDTREKVKSQRSKARQMQVIFALRKVLLFMLLGAIIAGISVQGMPLGAGTAFVGAAGPGLAGAAALAGIIFGYIGFHGLTASVQYIAAGVMVYTVAFVCQYLPASQKKWFMPAVVMLIAGLTVAYGTVSAVRYELPWVMHVAGEIALCGVLTAVYAKALWSCRSLDISSVSTLYARLILLGSLCSTLYGYEMGGYVSPGRLLAAYLAMQTAYGNSLAVGISGAGILGVVLGEEQALLYCLGAFAGKQWGDRNKCLFGGVFTTVCCLYLSVQLPLKIVLCRFYEFAGAIFLLQLGIGESRLYAAEEYQCSESVGQAVLRNQYADGIRKMADAFERVARQFQSRETDDIAAESSAVFDHAMDVVCESCSKRHGCRGSKRVDMLSLFMGVAPSVEKRGRMLETDLPEDFRERCFSYKSLVLCVNYELMHRTREQQRRESAGEAAALAVEQYQLFATVLRDAANCVSDGIRRAFRPEMAVKEYLRQRRLQCAVTGIYGNSHRLTLHITGTDIVKLMQRQSYLEELSQVLGMRLCAADIGENELCLYEAEPLAVTVGIAGRRKHGERVSGDSVRQFKTEGGFLYLLLSDGMGTGVPAQQESEGLITCLETLLRSGIGAETALEMINYLTYFQNAEAWKYATIDLLELDLFTGQVKLLKYGGADSYVYTGAEMTVISGQSLPVGMEIDVSPDIALFQMKPGSLGILVSDGVVMPEEERLKELIREYAYDMKGLSRSILLSDCGENAGDDDMTAIVFSVELRK